MDPASQVPESHRAHFSASKVPSRRLRFHGSCSPGAGKGCFRGPWECRHGLYQLCSGELGSRAGQVGPGRVTGSPDHSTLSKRVLAPPFPLPAPFLPPFLLPPLLSLPPTWPQLSLAPFTNSLLFPKGLCGCFQELRVLKC